MLRGAGLKPAIMLADVADGMVSGSGRAGQFLHLQAALETLGENMPGLLVSFGGHKAAAGLKIHKTDIQRFTNGFCEVVLEQLKDQDKKPCFSMPWKPRNRHGR
jgi:single-stranded-DNA-specific exonuclease